MVILSRKFCFQRSRELKIRNFTQWGTCHGRTSGEPLYYVFRFFKKPSITCLYLPYFQLLIHQIPYVIFETISHFSRRNSSVFFLAQTLHTFNKSSPSKCKFSDFPLLALKFTKFLMSFFKQKVSFTSKFGSLFSVIRDNCSVFF